MPLPLEIVIGFPVQVELNEKYLFEKIGLYNYWLS